MPQPLVSAAHYNAPMTNLSVSILQSTTAFIAHRLFPIIPVTKQSDIYWRFPRGAFGRLEMKQRAPGTNFARTGYTLETAGPYFCKTWGLEHPIDDSVRANADAVLNIDQTATRFLTHQGLMRREQSWLDAWWTHTAWTYYSTGVSTVPSTNEFKKWSDSNSDPIGVVKTARTNVQGATGFAPNVLVVTQKVWDKLSEHPDLVDRIKYSGGVGNGTPAKITLQAAAALFEVERIEVLGAIKNSGFEGGSDSWGFMAGDHAALFYIDPNPGLMTATAGVTFSWSGLLGNSAFGIAISEYRDEAITSDVKRIQMAFDMHQISADLAWFFKDVI